MIHPRTEHDVPEVVKKCVDLRRIVHDIGEKRLLTINISCQTIGSRNLQKRRDAREFLSDFKNAINCLGDTVVEIWRLQIPPILVIYQKSIGICPRWKSVGIHHFLPEWLASERIQSPCCIKLVNAK